MGVLQGTRVQHLVLTGAGTKPTVPTPSTLTANDSGWQSTNLHKGEWAYNETDDIWYYRQNNTIKEFSPDVSTKEDKNKKDATGGYAGLTDFKINFKNVVGNIISFFTNSNTAARTYTYQDRDGTIADDTDISEAKDRANHTGSQAASTITQDSSNRFVSDTEKNTWNSKADTSYVDAAIEGLKWKESARAASTANLTLSGTQTVDGVALIAGDRILVKDQTTGSQNGIYVVASGAWSRSSDANTSAEILGATINVREGSANADKDFVLTTDSITLGTTSLVFTEKGGNVPNGSETSAGKFEEATDAEVQANTSIGSTGAKLVLVVAKLWTWWTYVKTQANTWAAQQTFTLAPKFSSTTASKILKVDANKDITSGDVELTEMANQAGLTVLVNATNTTGKPTALQASTASRMLARTASNTLEWVQATTAMLLDLCVTTAKIAANAVSNDKLAQMAGGTVKGNLSSSSGNATDIPVANMYNDLQAMFHYNRDGINEVMDAGLNTGINNVTVYNTTVENTLFGTEIGSKTLPAFFWKIGKTIRISLRGFLSTSGSPTLQIKIKLGSITLATSGGVTITNTSNSYFEIEAVITCRSVGSSGELITQGKLIVTDTSNNSKMFGLVNTVATTVNTTVEQTIDITAQWGTADTANTITSAVRTINRTN